MVNLPPDENRALPGLSIYMWVGCGIATIAVALRLITRIVLKHAAGWDDFFIATSYLTAILLYTGTALLLSHGYGRHIYYIDPSDLIFMLKLNTMVNIAGFTSLALARASIGLFLLRLVERVKTWAWVVYLGLGLNVFQAVALIILTGVHCVPIQKMWDPSSSGFCIPAKQFTAVDRFFGCLNVIVDLLFALFPLVLLRNLQIERKIRLAVYLLLTCGLLASVCSIGRVVASDLTVEDITWDLVPLTYWALSETSGVLILACFPAMRQLFRHRKSSPVKPSYGNTIGSKTRRSKKPSDTNTDTCHPIDDTDSRKDLIFPGGNIRMQKDVYVELSDREPYRASEGKATGRGDDHSFHFSKATAEIV